MDNKILGKLKYDLKEAIDRKDISKIEEIRNIKIFIFLQFRKDFGIFITNNISRDQL